MSKIKRKIERIHEVKIKSPFVECSQDNEGFVVKILYDGEVATRRLPGTFLPYDDLALMERGIADAFNDMPWFDMSGLMNIVEWMLEETLVPIVKMV